MENRKQKTKGKSENVQKHISISLGKEQKGKCFNTILYEHKEEKKLLLTFGVESTSSS